MNETRSFLNHSLKLSINRTMQLTLKSYKQQKEALHVIGVLLYFQPLLIFESFRAKKFYSFLLH